MSPELALAFRLDLRPALNPGFRLGFWLDFRLRLPELPEFRGRAADDGKPWPGKAPPFADKRAEPVQIRLPEVPQAALPDHDDAPAEREQGLDIGAVAGLVALELGLPVLRVVLGHGGQPAAGMPVPEAAVHEDAGPVAPEHEIGLAGEVPAADAEAQAPAVDKGAQELFRLGVPASDVRHDRMPLVPCHGVRHGDPPPAACGGQACLAGKPTLLAGRV